jgi:hypothetical protein
MSFATTRARIALLPCTNFVLRGYGLLFWVSQLRIFDAAGAGFAQRRGLAIA